MRISASAPKGRKYAERRDAYCEHLPGDDSAGIYWPGSTNSVHVAEIYSLESSIGVEFRSFDAKFLRDGEMFNRIIQKDLFTGAPRQRPGLDLAEVQDIYEQVADDIMEIFHEYVG